MFICGRQYTCSMHKNEVKLLLFGSDIAGSEIKKMCGQNVSTHSAVAMTSSALNVVRADHGLFTSKFLSGNNGN